jgi:hypothetical protein
MSGKAFDPCHHAAFPHILTDRMPLGRADFHMTGKCCRSKLVLVLWMAQQSGRVAYTIDSGGCTVAMTRTEGLPLEPHWWQGSTAVLVHFQSCDGGVVC